MPPPDSGNYLFKVFIHGRPIQFTLYFCGVGRQDGRNARPSLLLKDLNGLAGYLAGQVNDLPHKVADAFAQVVGAAAGAIQKRLQGQQVGPDQAGNVNVVPDTGPVGSGVIGAENFDGLFGHCAFEHQGD